MPELQRTTILYILLLFLYILRIKCSLTTEAEALVRWKNTLNYSPLDSWSLDNVTGLCNWRGIVCNKSGSVSEINLPDSSITGTLFGLNFTSFPSLTRLDLRRNNFYGSIPPSISGASKLQYLDFTHNLFEAIPPEIGELKEIRYLKLFDNIINGTVPYQISYLPKVWYLDIGSNYLKNPQWSKFRSMPSVTYLIFALNHFTTGIPYFISQCANLTYLDLSENDLTGEIPESAFANLVKLEYLNLTDNFFRGPLPSNLTKLSKLRDLRLGKNNFTGSIPSGIGLMTNLRFIDMNTNRFRGKIPPSIGNLRQLEQLGLRMNKIEGPLPRTMVNCTSLQVLDLASNEIIDSFPHWLGTLSELQVLILASNRFRGELYVSNAKHPFMNLRILDASGNEFSGVLPGNFFEQFEGMMKVVEEENRKPYGQDSYLYSMQVVVKGRVVQVVRILNAFKTIDLSNNSIQGELPNSIGKLLSLRFLNLSDNHLTGIIPFSIGELSVVESLDLSSNRFVGGIPLELTKLTFLAFLNLSYNDLEGPIPRANQLITFENDSYLGNPALCGYPLTKQCKAKNNGSSVLPQELENSGFFDEFGWKVVFLGYGCGIPLGLSLGFVALSLGSPSIILRMVVQMEHRLKRRRVVRNRHSKRNARRRSQ